MLSQEEGKELLGLARNSIDSYFSKADIDLERYKKFDKKQGVFVTLNKNHQLRGCIGYPEPVMSIMKAVTESAVSVTRDPRFPPLSGEELDKIVVEVSVLTEPELIDVKDPKEYPKNIKIGQDGLVIEKGFNRGLLLPQVPVEWKWDAEEFLANLCMKAGLPSGMWLESGVKIYRFQSEIFSEKSPRGEIVKE